MKRRHSPTEEEKKKPSQRPGSPSYNECRLLRKNDKRTKRTQKKWSKKEETMRQREAIRAAAKTANLAKKQKEPGGMPHVFTYQRPGEGVAVKLIQKRTAIDPDINLPDVLAKIHEIRPTIHIISLLDYTEVRKRASTNPERVETYPMCKHTLDELLHSKHGKGLGLEDSATYLYGILDGIASLHKAGYIHGDLKPNNVALTAAKVVKIIDFGALAKIVKVKQPSTANEYYRFDKACEMDKTDLWAIGCMFVEMLTGSTMRSAKNSDVDKDLAKSMISIIELFPTASADIIDLLKKLMEREKHVDPEELLEHRFFVGRRRSDR